VGFAYGRTWSGPLLAVRLGLRALNEKPGNVDAFRAVSGRPARIVDVSEVQLRLEMIRVGVWVTYAVCATGAAYALVSLSQPNRPAILTVLGIGFAGGLVIQALPREKIVRSRAADAFFLSWSVVDIGLIAVMVGMDGGGKSPFAMVFFATIVFAALAYPLVLVVFVGALDVFAYLGAALVAGNPEPSFMAVIASCLGSVAVMCAWLAQNHERERAFLTVVSRSDPLTNCLNRRGFQERVEAELADALRSGQPLALLMLDLDGFKAVNDRLGHAAGDELLSWVASAARSAVRPTDAIGRLGGDEFALLLPETARGGAEEVAFRLRTQISERIGLTIGLACFPEDGADLEELYRAADRELYELKTGASQRDRGTELRWAQTLARAVSARMGDRGDDSRAVTLAVVLGKRLGFADAELEGLRVAALVHDIGKLPVPDRILQKPGPLDPGEYAELGSHIAKGAETLGRLDGLETLAPWLRHSHENYDGSGYPDGLRGQEIPIAARVLRVVDAFDAMTNDRPYRPAMSFDAALEQLRASAGRQFDPACVRELERYLVSEAAGRP
jgi:diguanylate cyclase (GGDEF)-like protein